MNLSNLSFENLLGFWVLIFLLGVFLVKSITQNYTEVFSKDMLNKIIVGSNTKSLNFILLSISFILLVIALARPVIKNEPVKVPQGSLNIMVAFDISSSMNCTDVYPTRLDFAKNKFNSLINNLNDEKVGAIAFSSASFLIAPITNDYLSLKYLVKNISTKYISVKGSSIMQALKSTNKLLKSKQKVLIVFSDGTDTNDFKDEIQYAKENNISVFVYAIATSKGGVIKTKTGIVKDSNGNIVVTRLNENIKSLALNTNGAYLQYSTSSNDIKEFINLIREKFKEKKKRDIIINTNQELFYFPLGLAFIFIFIALSGFKRGSK